MNWGCSLGFLQLDFQIGSELFYLKPFSLFISKYYFPLPLLSPRKACGLLPHARSFLTVGYHYPDIQTLHPSPFRRMLFSRIFYSLVCKTHPGVKSRAAWRWLSVLGARSKPSRGLEEAANANGLAVHPTAFSRTGVVSILLFSWEQSERIHTHSKPSAPTESRGGGTDGKKMCILRLQDYF